MTRWAAVAIGLLTCGGLPGQWFPVQFESPVYPPLANQARIEGVVTLNLTLASDGRVASAERVSGDPVLARAAAANALTWRFAQACREKPPASIEFKYVFRLQGSSNQNPTTRSRYQHPYVMTVISEALHWMPTDGKTKRGPS
jgi:TonB family protein